MDPGFQKALRQNADGSLHKLRDLGCKFLLRVQKGILRQSYVDFRSQVNSEEHISGENVL